MEPRPASDALITSTPGGEGRLEESSDIAPCQLDRDRLRRKTSGSPSRSRRSKTRGQPIGQVFLLGHDAELIEGTVLDLPHSLLGRAEDLAHLAQPGATSCHRAPQNTRLETVPPAQLHLRTHGELSPPMDSSRSAESSPGLTRVAGRVTIVNQNSSMVLTTLTNSPNRIGLEM